jgi:hypothetical protein
MVERHRLWSTYTYVPRCSFKYLSLNFNSTMICLFKVAVL